MTEWRRLPARQLAAQLREGTLSARALLDYYLERVERLNPGLNAFVAMDPESFAAAEASDARLRAGRPRSLLEGIPISIKDNLLARGCPAAWGSPLYDAFIPDQDELPVARVRGAGAVIMGKTNTSEFSLRGFTDNPVYGPTFNPWNTALTPGGSSGGAAAAVAAGLSPLALATDGGGSIRRPAAHTGLVGLKPGGGRIERGLGFPPLMFDCEVVGPMARRVDDARILFDSLAAHGRMFSTPNRPRVLVVERFGDAPIEPFLVERCREAAANLASLGCEMAFGDLPFDIGAANLAWQTLTSIGLSRLAEREPRFSEMASPEFVDQALGGAGFSHADYEEFTRTLFQFRTVVADAFSAIDLIVTPATAAQPWPADRPYPPVIDGQAVGPRGHAVFTAWVNACGCPGIAVPTRPDSDGMPVGVQMVAAQGRDEMLLDLAERYETAFHLSDLWPARS